MTGRNPTYPVSAPLRNFIQPSRREASVYTLLFTILNMLFLCFVLFVFDINELRGISVCVLSIHAWHRIASMYMSMSMSMFESMSMSFQISRHNK